MDIFNFLNKDAKNQKEVNKAKADSLLINKIEAYVPNITELLNSAAECEKMDELEGIINKKLPENFRKLYLEHNGEGEMIYGVMAGFRWMDINSVIRAWRALQESAYEIISDKDGLIQEGRFKKGWIPFAEDCGGSFIVMDLEPGSKGNYGQIITIDRNSDTSYVVSESLGMFLEFIEDSFKAGNLNTLQDEDVKIIQLKRGHLFDDIIALSGLTIEKGSLKISSFWTEYYKDKAVNGRISTDILAKERMVFIKADMAQKHGSITLDILKCMPNLKELIIHAEEISSFEPIKALSSLTKLVIGSKSFRDSDLKYLGGIEKLKQLTLVKLSLNGLQALQGIKSLKCLRLYKVQLSNNCSIGCLQNLTELSMEDMEAGDLSFISNLMKLTKLELKKVDIQNLKFLQGLKKLSAFYTDKRAVDESHIGVFEEMSKLEVLIYPIGDMKIIKNCLNLKEVGIDASRLDGLENIRGLNLTGVTIFNPASKDNAESVVAEVEKYCKLQSYGWQQTWKS